MYSDSKMKKVYVESAGAIAYVSVVDIKTSDAGIGTAFHVGNGIFVTARHVVEDKEILEVATTKQALVEVNNGVTSEGTYNVARPKKFKVINGPFLSKDNSVDVAVFKVDMDSDNFPKLKLDSHTSHEIDDNTFLLHDVLVIGYPPIPFSTVPTQVVSLGVVNAVVDVRHSPHAHFIVSTMARGGFSGGPVISEDGSVIGIVTESLVYNNSQVETGYMSILCAEAIIREIQKYYDYDLVANGIWRDSDTLYEVKLRRQDSSSLNTRVSDAVVYVYDDDYNVFGKIECDDLAVLDKAVFSFNEISAISKVEQYCSDTVYSFSPSGCAFTMRKAAMAARSVFVENGYHEYSVKENDWQYNSELDLDSGYDTDSIL